MRRMNAGKSEAAKSANMRPNIEPSGGGAGAVALLLRLLADFGVGSDGQRAGLEMETWAMLERPKVMSIH